MSVATTWGTTEEERSLAFPCDRWLERFDAAYYRGVTVHAPPGIVFRWLCQMRVAPYSYDWIDNFGRKSPRELTPGLDELEIGQRVMGSFDLIEFERDRHLTLRLRRDALEARFVRDFAVSYFIVTRTSGCRLLVKLGVRHGRGPVGRLMRLLVPWGDWVMMRRQLLNFKELAERTALAVTL